jgi:hypothetical protein
MDNEPRKSIPEAEFETMMKDMQGRVAYTCGISFSTMNRTMHGSERLQIRNPAFPDMSACMYVSV